MLNTLPPLVTKVGRAEEFFGTLKGRSSFQKNICSAKLIEIRSEDA